MLIYKLNRHFSNGCIRCGSEDISLAIIFKYGAKLIFSHQAGLLKRRETNLTIIAAIILFGIIVFIHELGHFLFAKKAVVRIHEFSIGMGPKI